MQRDSASTLAFSPLMTTNNRIISIELGWVILKNNVTGIVGVGSFE